MSETVEITVRGFSHRPAWLDEALRGDIVSLVMDGAEETDRWRVGMYSHFPEGNRPVAVPGMRLAPGANGTVVVG